MFFDSISFCPITLLKRARLGFHGNETMVIQFIKFADEMSKRTSNGTLYVHLLPRFSMRALHLFPAYLFQSVLFVVFRSTDIWHI
jgi:hypothetical protein